MSASARHVAIVMDGNAQWAERRGLSVEEGQRAGMDTLKDRLGDAVDLGIEQLTVIEATSLPKLELARLVQMLDERIASDCPAFKGERVRMRFIGRRIGISAELVERMERVEAKASTSERITFFFALDYRGRAEILDAARAVDTEDEEDFRAHLYAPEIQEPDLLIRTGGERRLSGCLLWQCAYSELVFRDEPWPDFDRVALEECLDEFHARQRRFGARL
jgi:undecaprenyl diphosphate synthase